MQSAFLFPSKFTPGSNHSVIEIAHAETKQAAGGWPPALLLESGEACGNQVQLIKPLIEELQVFVVSVCVATAVQPAGGPATAVAVTVTFCDGVKPCAVPAPEKYAPALSAA